MQSFLELMPGDWGDALAEVLQSSQSQHLLAFLQQEIAAGKSIFPAQSQWFRCFEASPLQATRVVILGQDPYPTAGHAHGLSFSVNPELTRLPKSLNNIFKELEQDLGIQNRCGDLSFWAGQGVLLLNTILTVEQGQAGSHRNKGWEAITDAAIAVLNQQPRSIVFLLWGGHAQKKAKLMDRQRHCVLESVHPSPLSAYRGFFGSKPFSQINDHLVQVCGEPAIDWRTHGPR